MNICAYFNKSSRFDFISLKESYLSYFIIISISVNSIPHAAFAQRLRGSSPPQLVYCIVSASASEVTLDQDKQRENSKMLVLKGRQSLEQDKDNGLHWPSLPQTAACFLKLPKVGHY